MITIKKIAEITNVSRGTVDRVLNNRGGVNIETEKKIRDAIKMLNYSPNEAGQNLAIRKKRLKFGFILFTHSSYNPFFESVEMGIRRKAAELETFGISVDIQYTSFNAYEKQLELLNYFASNQYSGVAITALNTIEIINKINELSDNDLPIVTVNTDIPNSKRLAYVGSNYYNCGNVAGNFMGLITQGSAKIGIIEGSHDITCLTERSAGFFDYLSKHYPNMQIVSTARNNRYDEIENYSLTKKMLEEHPEINALYLSAAGVNGACKAISEVARPIKVIAYDCIPRNLQLLEQGLVTAIIDQDPFYQGSKPLDILFEATTTGVSNIKEHYYTDAIIKIPTNL